MPKTKVTYSSSPPISNSNSFLYDSSMESAIHSTRPLDDSYMPFTQSSQMMSQVDGEGEGEREGENENQIPHDENEGKWNGKYDVSNNKNNNIMYDDDNDNDHDNNNDNSNQNHPDSVSPPSASNDPLSSSCLPLPLSPPLSSTLPLDVLLSVLLSSNLSDLIHPLHSCYEVGHRQISLSHQSRLLHVALQNNLHDSTWAVAEGSAIHFLDFVTSLSVPLELAEERQTFFLRISIQIIVEKVINYQYLSGPNAKDNDKNTLDIMETFQNICQFWRECRLHLPIPKVLSDLLSLLGSKNKTRIHTFCERFPYLAFKNFAMKFLGKVESLWDVEDIKWIIKETKGKEKGKGKEKEKEIYDGDHEHHIETKDHTDSTHSDKNNNNNNNNNNNDTIESKDLHHVNLIDIHTPPTVPPVSVSVEIPQDKQMEMEIPQEKEKEFPKTRKSLRSHSLIPQIPIPLAASVSSSMIIGETLEKDNANDNEQSPSTSPPLPLPLPFPFPSSSSVSFCSLKRLFPSHFALSSDELNQLVTEMEERKKRKVIQ